MKTIWNYIITALLTIVGLIIATLAIVLSRGLWLFAASLLIGYGYRMIGLDAQFSWGVVTYTLFYLLMQGWKTDIELFLYYFNGKIPSFGVPVPGKEVDIGMHPMAINALNNGDYNGYAYWSTQK